MSIFSKFTEGCRNYRKTTKDMSFKEKVSYTKDYYLKPVLFIAAVLIVLISIITTSIIKINTDVILYGVGVNTDLTTDGTEYVKDDFFKLHKTKGRQDIEYSCVTIDDFTTKTNIDSSYYSAQSVVAQVAAKRLDYLFVDEIAFQYFAAQEIYMDLNDILSGEEMVQWANHILYTQEEGSDVMTPMGIDISETKFAQKFNSVKDRKIILCFAGNAPHKELVYEFFHYVVNYNG